MSVIRIADVCRNVQRHVTDKCNQERIEKQNRQKRHYCSTVATFSVRSLPKNRDFKPITNKSFQETKNKQQDSKKFHLEKNNTSVQKKSRLGSHRLVSVSLSMMLRCRTLVAFEGHQTTDSNMCCCTALEIDSALLFHVRIDYGYQYHDFHFSATG